MLGDGLVFLHFVVTCKEVKKVTFNSIHEHLEKLYKTKLAYGSVVQMCVVRNKRKLSSKRYKGVANVTCRRARKGFTVRLNPDAHWSSAFYRSLDKLQLTDGINKLVFDLTLLMTTNIQRQLH